MIDESKLYAFLAELYEHLKTQADAVYHLQRQVSGLAAALQLSSQEMVDAYTVGYVQFDVENLDRYNEARQSLDAIIQILKAGKI